jgi:hypothetical protein
VIAFEQVLAIGTFVIATIGLFVRPLLNAVWEPTPGGAVFITSISYLIGTSIVAVRDGSESAFFVFLVAAVFVPIYSITFIGIGKALRLQTTPASALQPIGPRRSASAVKWFGFVLLSCLMAFVIYATGTDALLAGLFQFVVLGDADISIMDLRLSFAAGDDQWLAPGYVKQIRDILLPLSAFTVLFTIRRSALRFYLVASLVVPIVVALMISSGERGPVMLFLVGAVYCALDSVRQGIHRFRAVAAPILLVVILASAAFSALTSSFISRDYGDTSFVVILADRVVTRVPEENVQGAAVWRRGAPFPGAGWFSEVASVLPGTQFTLSNFIHAELGGGDRGNSVLGLWADVYYNFQWLLGVPVAMFLGVAVALFNHWVNTRRGRSTAAAVCGTWISVTMLVVLSPFGFLLYGPFLLSMVLWFIGLLTSWSSKPPVPESSASALRE